MKFALILFFISISFGCTQNKQPKSNLGSLGVKTYNFNEFEGAFLNPTTKRIQVINFWATWCRPCVKELPYFEELAENDKDIEVILVSLDLNTQKESKLIPFVKARKMKSKIIHLDEPDANAWIPKVDKNWSGAIPATIIMNKNKKRFYEQSFDYNSLVKAITTFKNEK